MSSRSTSNTSLMFALVNAVGAVTASSTVFCVIQLSAKTFGHLGVSIVLIRSDLLGIEILLLAQDPPPT